MYRENTKRLIRLARNRIYKEFGGFIYSNDLVEDIDQEMKAVTWECLLKRKDKPSYIYTAIINRLYSFLKKETKHNVRKAEIADIPIIDPIEEKVFLLEKETK